MSDSHTHSQFISVFGVSVRSFMYQHSCTLRTSMTMMMMMITQWNGRQDWLHWTKIKKSNWSNFDASASIAGRNAFSVSTIFFRKLLPNEFCATDGRIRHIRAGAAESPRFSIFSLFTLFRRIPFISLFRSDSDIMDSVFVWIEIIFFRLTWSACRRRMHQYELRRLLTTCIQIWCDRTLVYFRRGLAATANTNSKIFPSIHIWKAYCVSLPIAELSEGMHFLGAL